MGYTSSKVKDRYNRKHYDCIVARLPIGCKNEIQTAAKANGLSMAQYIRWAILQAMSEEERKQSPVLSGRKPEDIENGYVSPFPPPPRRTERLISRFLGGV